MGSGVESGVHGAGPRECGDRPHAIDSTRPFYQSYQEVKHEQLSVFRHRRKT